MTQTRLHFTAGRDEARRLFPGLEMLFEEDGFALAVLELDENTGLQELSVYADGDIDAVAARVEGLIREHGVAAAVAREALLDIDWVALSLQGLKPVRAGRVLVHGAHDREQRRIGDVAVEIEAGLAFGTGHHGTTAGCLEMMQTVLRRERPKRALDLGTGSAVLAIAHAKLTRRPILATDIDPVAIQVAAANAQANGVGNLVATLVASGFHHPAFSRRGPFDLIVANILAGPLMRLAPKMAAHLTLGGSLIVSGILDRQRDAVLATYAGQRFRHVATLPREGWVTMHFKR